MYADVVVLTYQSPETQFYTYEIPKDLENIIKVGQLVSVPFGKRNPMGVVADLKNTVPSHPGVATTVLEGGTTDRIGSRDSIVLHNAGLQNDKMIEIKPIASILFPTPFLLPYQIELLKWMSFYYHAPMVNCLEAMLPVEALNAKRLTTNAENFSVKRLALSIQQTLVLVPTINRLPETLAQYTNAKNYIIYHSELKASERFGVWQKIISGQTNFIFGTRSAIFTPCPNLEKIIIFDEHDNTYKDERSPYYDTLTVADKLQKLTGAKLEIVDSAPKITTYFNFTNSSTPGVRSRRHLDYTPGVSLGKVTKVQIVSMLSEKAAGNKSPISGLLENYIELGFKRNKKILLFLNKKTESGHIYCKSCKFSDFAITQPEVCPNCQSSDFFFNSLNVLSLKTLVQKIIPRGNINTITQTHPRGELSSALAHPGGVQSGTIDIATAAVFYKLLAQKYNLVAHIRTDSILTITDYTSTEQLYRQITDLKKLTRGLLLLQTFNPENEVLKAAASNNYQAFYKQEIALRKSLLYPPFALLVKLSTKGMKEETVEQKAQLLFDNLNQSSVNGHLSTVIILGPYKSSFSQKIPKYNIILKIPIEQYSLEEKEKVVKNISPFLSKVPRDWQIVIEPDSIN